MLQKLKNGQLHRLEVTWKKRQGVENRSLVHAARYITVSPCAGLGFQGSFGFFQEQLMCKELMLSMWFENCGSGRRLEQMQVGLRMEVNYNVFLSNHLGGNSFMLAVKRTTQRTRDILKIQEKHLIN